MNINDWKIGYCTNVHAGTDLESIVANLRTHATEVRRRLGIEHELPVGLWIPNDAAVELTASGNSLQRKVWLREQLAEMRLAPYTINGFPYGNFHQSVVKHQVYQPAWWEPERTNYTLRLCLILDALLPAGEVGSISTLPLGWGEITDEQRDQAGENLLAVAGFLRQLEESTGRRIVIAIEPEPGCAIDKTADMINFFEDYFPGRSTGWDERRYLTVCHDICHAAVMDESQADVLKRFAENQITVGKFQVSSAIEVRWEDMDDSAADEALEQLRGFAEDRYLHQTVRKNANDELRLFEDLPDLLANTTTRPDDRYWRIHFHVPIGLESFGRLLSTRPQVLECLDAIERMPAEYRVNHLEVETYAWGVLPVEMRQTTLAESIAEELKWLRSVITPVV